MTKVLPTDMLSYISSFLNSSDVPFFASTSREMGDVIRKSKHMRPRLDIVSAPKSVIDNPARLGLLTDTKTISLFGSRGTILDLSQTRIDTLILDTCRFTNLILPPTLRHIHISSLWLDKDQTLDLSLLALETVDLRRLSCVVIFPQETSNIHFLRASRFRRGEAIDKLFTYLGDHDFPSLNFLDVMFNFDTPVLSDLKQMPLVKTLFCNRELFSPDATIPHVQQLVISISTAQMGNIVIPDFPHVTKMTLVLLETISDESLSSINLPPHVDTLVILSEDFIPKYLNSSPSSVQNLIVYVNWKEMDEKEPEDEDELDEFYAYSLPSVPYFRIGFSQYTNAEVFFDVNPHLVPYTLEHDESKDTIEKQVADMMGMNVEQYDLNMIEHSLSYKPSSRNDIPIKDKWENVRGSRDRYILPTQYTRPREVSVPYESLSMLFAPHNSQALHHQVWQYVTDPLVLQRLSQLNATSQHRALQMLIFQIARQLASKDPMSEEDPRILWAMQDMVSRIITKGASCPF